MATFLFFHGVSGRGKRCCRRRSTWPLSLTTAGLVCLLALCVCVCACVHAAQLEQSTVEADWESGMGNRSGDGERSFTLIRAWD